MGPPAVGTIEVEWHPLDGPFDATVGPSGVWTGTEAIFWGGLRYVPDPPWYDTAATNSGIAYNPSAERWRQLRDAPIEPRSFAGATWTGQEMLVWGGARDSGRMARGGAAYDPETDRWSVMAEAPSAWQRRAADRWYDQEVQPAHVWTGSEWVIGFEDPREDQSYFVSMAAYNREQDSWRLLPDAPGSSTSASQLVWTGDSLVLRSYEAVVQLGPGDSSWTPISEMPWGEPPVSIVWDGEHLVGAGNYLAEWSPQADAWQTYPPPPSGAWGDLALSGDFIVPIGSSLAYDSVSQEWWQLSRSMSVYREFSVRVWTADELIYWGGWECGECLDGVFDTGIVYTPRW